MKKINLDKLEVALAVASFALIGIIYFVIFPESYKTTSMNVHIYRPLVYVIFGFVLPISLFGVKGYMARYGFQRKGLGKSVIISAVFALPLLFLGYKLAAGPVPPLLTWYVLNIMEETYFRGLWQRAGGYLAGSFGAILIPAVLFGVYHLTAGFTPVQAIGPFFIGLVFGWVRKDTDNILGPILMHAFLVTGMWLASF